MTVLIILVSIICVLSGSLFWFKSASPDVQDQDELAQLVQARRPPLGDSLERLGSDKR